MVYSKNFVLTVLSNGRVAKDFANGAVPLPFGSEFSVRLRNKNNRRAVVKLFIDGENVSAGGYIIPANDYVDIERFAEKAAKFKFVSLDSEEAHDFGKDGSNHDKVKGVVEAHFYLEKEKSNSSVLQAPHFPAYPPYNHFLYNPHAPYFSPHVTWRCDNKSAGNNAGNAYGITSRGCVGEPPLGGLSLQNCVNNVMDFLGNSDLKDGATVEGNASSQRFRPESIDIEADFVSVKLFLQGYAPKLEDETNSKKPYTTESVLWEDIEKAKKKQENLQSKIAEAINEKAARLENKALLNKLNEIEAENEKMRQQLEELQSA